MRKYKEALEKKGITAYKAAEMLGCTRQYLGRVLTGKVGAGSNFEERWIKAYGELPEDDGIVRERSASPKIIREKVPTKILSYEEVMNQLQKGVEDRIRKFADSTSLPGSSDELFKMAMGIWATGVKDAVKIFASANAGED
ncbi:MAG: helix-turn-helix transcriptional regulator [Lachnospiraceae bacterium]|nr:helix-turn-helix transcriptional regulator [Lachnospiraceae bacterium]